MHKTRTTNILLLLLVIPVLFYLLKLLSFIFIPLVFSMFTALMFLPITRWFKKLKISKTLSISAVILLIVGIMKLGGMLFKLASKEILSVDSTMITRIQIKLTEAISLLESFFGLERLPGENIVAHYFTEFNLAENLGSTINMVSDTLTMSLMTIFFAILWLAESINFQKLLNSTILKRRLTSIRVFRRIEKDLIKFVLVKVFVSLLTGIGFSIACLIFDVSFPIFWGLLAFLINFIQMIGSFISVAALSLFGLVELDTSGTLLLFVLFIIGIQAIMGAVLEPILLGKTFSINIITILIMLMFWGFIWGIPGLILSIPLTVFFKIIMEQYQGTRIIAQIMAGNDNQ